MVTGGGSTHECQGNENKSGVIKMEKVVLGILIVFALVMSVIGSGCIGLGNSVDVCTASDPFRCQYKQYDYVASWDTVETNEFWGTSTVDLHFVYGKTIRLHDVVSIDIID